MADVPPPTYTTQDYSAVNTYVEHLAARHRSAISIRRAGVFATYAKWCAVLVVASGVTALLVLWGLSLLKEKPDPKIVEPVIVDRPVTINVPGLDSSLENNGNPEVQRQLSEIRSTIADVRAGSSVDTPTTESLRTVIDFVIFKEVQFSQAGLEEVVVGMRYQDSSSENPSTQRCYVNKPNDSGAETRVNLARKEGPQRIDDILTTAMAREIGAPLGVLKEAQSLCAFE